MTVPLLAAAFGGRTSVGVMLPMLVFADLFAAGWYRRHARWDELRRISPGVVLGLGLGAAALWAFGAMPGEVDIMAKAIGWLALLMVAAHLVRSRISPGQLSKLSVAILGATAGFATTVANAAGPVMTIYLTAQRLPKEQFMGTHAWYFLIFNLVKLPIYSAITLLTPDQPLFSSFSILFNLYMAPVIVVGALLGRQLFPRIPKKMFENLALGFAAIASVYLIAK